MNTSHSASMKFDTWYATYENLVKSADSFLSDHHDRQDAAQYNQIQISHAIETGAKTFRQPGIHTAGC